MIRVAIDFGTSSTCIAVSVHGREPQVVAVDGHPLMSSAVYAAPDGTLFVGQEADRQAAIDPSRYEPHPKRRIDETELLLGSTVIGVRDVIRSVLTRALAEARRVAGGAPVDQLVLTHPADWGGIRTQVLRRAANALAARIVLVPEPVAAAVFHAASFPPAQGMPDRALAVLDVGGGTVDVSVVRREQPSYRVLATRGDPSFGGADVDQLLLDHVGSLVSTVDKEAWSALLEGRDLPNRRRRRVIHQDVRNAKETLSRHPYTDVPLPPPFPDAHVTRDDLEGLIAIPLRRAAGLAEAAIREAGLRPDQLAGIFLVGGSSRIPLVARLIHERCGVVPTSIDQPETVVARGALRAINPEPEHTGVVSTQPPPRMPPPTTPARGHPLPPPRRKRRLPLVIAGLVVLIGAAGTAVLLLTGNDEPPSNRMIAQYEYQFPLPENWTQTGGDPAKHRTELKPSGAESGPDLILVEETRLSFDSDADRPRAVNKLRTDYENAGDTFSGFDEHATFATRPVIHYQQRLDKTNATVDWYVVFKSHTQVSIGCQYTAAARATVLPACESVTRSLTITE